jgi:hypothetical protein
MLRYVLALFGFAFAISFSSSVFGELVTLEFAGHVTAVQDDPSNLISANF